MVHGLGLHRRDRGAVERVADQRKQRPLHARCAHRVAHAPARADDLGQRRCRSLPAARRADRGDPPRRPRLLRAGRGALARRRADTVDDPHRDATGRRSGQRRHLGRARHRRGVRRSAGSRELMRATVMYGAGDVRIENVPDATIIEPTDAVVRVTRACICGSDLWPYKTMEPSDNGRVMGHEAIGVVEAVGPDVRNIKRGDLVVMPFAFSDGTCVFCHERLQTSCVHGGFFGTVDVPGAQAEAVRVPQADGTLVVLPVGEDDALMPSLLTLTDVMGTGHHAAVAAKVGPAKTVAVVGDGAVGLCGVIASKRLGAERIILLGNNPDRITLGQEFGATDVVRERGEEAVERVRELTGGFGAHSVLECVGLEQAVVTALEVARPGGAIGRVGVPEHDTTATGVAFWKNASIAGGPAPVRAYIDELLPDVLEGRIEPGRVFDRTGTLDEVPDGYRAMNDRDVLKFQIEL